MVKITSRAAGFLITLCFCWIAASCMPQDKHVLKLGANNWLGYQPFFAAQSEGYWNSEEISVVELGSSTEVIRALSNQSIDAAALTLDEAISARVRNSSLQILMVLDFSFGGDVLIASPDLTTLEDLKGKTVAVESTALGALMLDAVYNASALEENDFIVRNVSFEEHAKVLQRGQVDAVITFEPVRSQLLAQGYRDLFNSKRIPERIVDVLVVPELILQRYPERVKALMHGFLSARKLVIDQNVSTIADIGKRTRLASQAVIAGYEHLKMPGLEDNQKLMSQCGSGLKETARTIMRIMLERRIIHEPVNLDRLCHSQLIHEIVL